MLIVAREELRLFRDSIPIQTLSRRNEKEKEKTRGRWRKDILNRSGGEISFGMITHHLDETTLTTLNPAE